MKFQPIDFKNIIFDMDGVITSEYIYWDTAALTVYELLLDYRFYGKSEIDRESCLENYGELRRLIFDNDKTIRAVKALGVNTNWDLAYLTFCVSRYLEPELECLDEWHFRSVRMFIENIEAKAPEVYGLAGELAAGACGKPKEEFERTTGELWKNLQFCFQRWFKDDGLCGREKPLIPIEKIHAVLDHLKKSGLKLGVGTGRPRDEIMYPLKSWDLLKYFDENMIVTYDEVSAAEQNLRLTTSIAKPHPYVFLKAALGLDYPDKKIVGSAYAKSVAGATAVVGDAPSDFLAARVAEMPFVGVLTGVDKAAAEAYFKTNKADYIFDDITGFLPENI